jgi:ribose transport system substrate-binding protein
MRRSVLAVSVGIGLSLVAACSSGSNTTSQSSGSGGSGGPQVTVGVVDISATDTATNALVKGFTKASEAKGWKVIETNANGNVDQANSAIQNFVTRKVSAILVTVFATNSLAEGLQAAKAANIPVISHGGGAGAGISADWDGNGGTVVTDAMAKAMGGTGSVLAFTYRPGTPCLEREKSLDAVLKNYPNIKVEKQQIDVNSAPQSGANFTQAWLTRHPQGSGNLAVWGCYDDPALGAVSALRAAGRSDVKVWGFNASKAAQDAIRAGTMSGSLWFNVDASGVQEADTLAKILQSPSGWTAKTFQVPTILVTKSNLDQFLSAHPVAAQG